MVVVAFDTLHDRSNVPAASPSHGKLKNVIACPSGRQKRYIGSVHLSVNLFILSIRKHQSTPSTLILPHLVSDLLQFSKNVSTWQGVHQHSGANREETVELLRRRKYWSDGTYKSFPNHRSWQLTNNTSASPRQLHDRHMAVLRSGHPRRILPPWRSSCTYTRRCHLALQDL